MRFAEAQPRHAVLALQASPLDVLAMLAQVGIHERGDRDALSWALVTEQRALPHPLWAALLLLAYEPMLLRLRRRINPGTWLSSDLNQLVVSAFLEVIAAFPAVREAEHTSAYLRDTTARRVFVKLAAQRRDDMIVQLVSPHWLAETVINGDQVLDTVELLPPPTPEETEALVARLVEVVGEAANATELRLVADTFVRGERLITYVGRLYPDASPAEHARLYERLKRQRSRLVARLRRPLGGLRVAVSPEELAP